MKRNLPTIFLIVFFALIGCRKDPIIDNTTNGIKFVPGDLIVGITKETELSTVFDTLNSLEISIKNVKGFHYKCYLPADSVNYLIKLFNQKPYVKTDYWAATKGNVYFSVKENAILLLFGKFNMKLEYQIDFLETIKKMGLIDMKSDVRSLHLNVPIGTEKFWLNELKKYSFIRWTELNLMGTIKPQN